MPQVRLLERAFEGCSRVIVTKLHGGFSGSLVLKTGSYGPDGSPDEPTVTKLDDAVSMLDEVKKTAEFTKLVGASAAQVQWGPFLVDAYGQPIEPSKEKDFSGVELDKEKDLGCVVLDMAGACWVMPEFHGKLDTELISTFKRHIVRKFLEPGSEKYVDAMDVMQELWGAGGPLRVLALKTFKRPDTFATKPGGLIEGALRDITTSLIVAFRAPNGEEGSDPTKPYSTPVLLDNCISKVLATRPNWSKKVDDRRDRSKVFKNSLVHDCDAAVWRDEDTCKALVDLVEELESLLKPGDGAWLTDYKPLRMHQHGDLNCGNILVDVRESLWLIDFATAGENALFKDAAKMVSVILFEQFPVPLTLAELQSGKFEKLVDALGASEEEAKDLMNLGEACKWHSKAALLKAIEDREADKSQATEGEAYATHELLLQRIDDDSVAEKRAKEACDVIDLLFKSGADGKQPQLWEMDDRKPPEGLSDYALLALQLCTRVMKVTTELVTECSRREQEADAFAEDLHPVHFLLPLLTRALCSVRYFQCGAWQKRVAWHAAQRLAEALTPLLRQPAQPLPVSADQVLATELQLVAGQPITMLGSAGKLDGELGQRRLFLARAEEQPSAQRFISDEMHPLTFDQVDQTVLPWHPPSPEAVGSVLEVAEHDLATTIPALLALVQTVPSLETLSKERAHGENGKAVSYLLKQVQQIAPKSQEFQDSVNLEQVATRIKDACREDKRKVEILQKSAGGPMPKAKLDDKESRELDIQIDEAGRLLYPLKEDPRRREWMRELTHLQRSLQQAIMFNELKLKESVEKLTMDQLQGVNRSYAIGQRLLVHQNGDWHDQVVTLSVRGTAQHQLNGDLGQLSIALHPWNHAPLVFSLASFKALRSRYASTLRSQHASIVDALSGQRLDIFDQCVPIKVVTTAKQTSSNLANVNDVQGLASWLLAAHAARRDAPADAGPAACLLLTAPPAAGKTCLVSQLVMHILQSKECDMVPILIKVQELQRHLLSEATRPNFERSWNWVDAFLECVHGAGSDLYRMLRQALMARRALVLLDGIDEGGKARDKIERHVTEVLAPQGHVMLVTSRPAGLKESHFSQHFVHVQLEPLSDEQQKAVIVKRLGNVEHSELLEYLHDPNRVPLDDKKQRVTGNPLMLSMVISIFQSKQATATAMPATITELYETASKAMLERVDRKERGAAASAAAVPHLTSLLEATFFEAHAAEVRDFGDAQLNRAARAVFAPNVPAPLAHKWEALRSWTSGKIGQSEFEIRDSRYQTRASEINVIAYQTRQEVPPAGTEVIHQGKERVISSVIKMSPTTRYQMFLLEETEQTKRAAKADYEAELNLACAALPTEAKEALRVVRERVAQDRLPLLSLLEAEPLQMRSSHLSFQEYYVVRAICTGKHLLPRDSPPWKWGPFWANVAKLGSENGTKFGSGLLRAAGVEGDELNLSGELGGDRPTVIGVVCALLGSLRVLDLSLNQLGPEGGAALAEGLKGNSTLESLK